MAVIIHPNGHLELLESSKHNNNSFPISKAKTTGVVIEKNKCVKDPGAHSKVERGGLKSAA
jgi:hypothetical protein